MSAKKSFLAVFSVVLLIAVVHIFTVGYGFGYDAISISRQAVRDAKQYNPSHLAVIYERQVDKRNDFLHLEIDTTYRAIGRNAFLREVVCDRQLRLRAFDGSYIDCSKQAERCFILADNGLEWQTLSHKRQIIGQECLAAEAYIDGKRYQAWYTMALPHLEDGAKESKELAGLILEASDSEGRYSLRAKYIAQHLG